MEIVHIDMDMFFAAVEIRDNPRLAGKPLVIGALPGERGVVSTCSYEAREYGIRSAMNIKEAYRRCPQAVFMHPNGDKYVKASSEIRKIWEEYTDRIECISLDEAFLDVTASSELFGGAEAIGHAIKRRIKEEVGLPCSVGIGYSMMAAKLASEEKKPDGFFQILTPEALKDLIANRGVQAIYGVGPQTEKELRNIGVFTVRDLSENRAMVERLLGNQGKQLVALADGIDPRAVSPPAKAHSRGREITFQRDTSDRSYLKDILRLIARELAFELRLNKTYAKTITLKITFHDMKKITRSTSGEATSKGEVIYRRAAELLDKVEKRPIRLIGISLSGFSDTHERQLSFFHDDEREEKTEKLDSSLLALQKKYGLDIVKSGGELLAATRCKETTE